MRIRLPTSSHSCGALPRSLTSPSRACCDRVRPAYANCIRLTAKCFVVLGLLFLSGCSDDSVEQTLKTMSGNEYLALSDAEKTDFVARSIDRFTTWQFWKRPDLCDYVLDPGVLASLYATSAEKAGDNLLVFMFSVDANDECVARGQVFK